MNRRETLLVCVVIFCGLVGGWISRAAEEHKGDWTLMRTDEPGKVDFAFIEHRHGGSSHHESSWPLSVFVGLDVSKPGKQSVKFNYYPGRRKI